jgi:uncharacterized protein YydD (DUF2326 family)
MRISRLYTNKSELFHPIQFGPGFNVVFAEIRLPENKSKDTHNLGKTTLGRVIDFCLLAKRDPSFFLFKHFDLFRDFVFFLEVELLDSSFLTIRRGVENPVRIMFKRHDRPEKDFSDLPESSWDHEVAFEKAKEMLDGILDLRELKPDSYRSIVGYLLRTQNDFHNVFQLHKFAGPQSTWKPFLAHLLGFNATIIRKHYEKAEELDIKKEEEEVIKRELGGSIADISKIEGMLLLKQKEAEKKQRLLDTFNFRYDDKKKCKSLVDEMDSKIARLNTERYSIYQNKKKVTAALEDDEILFDTKRASALFAESKIVFGGQIKKDFEQLIAFNRAITEERRGYLKEELSECEVELKRVSAELDELSKRRAETLSFLSETDVFVKYKNVTNELVTLKADVLLFEKQRGFLRRLQELRANIRTISEERDRLQIQIESDVEHQNFAKDSVFSTIRVYFNEIVEEVIDRKALLSVASNQYGHLEFKAEILDDSGNVTSADLGFTYRKLLCIAFDLALMRAHLNDRYPRFVFHDGVFESLDDRKKENLLSVIRAYAKMGIQCIISLIDSDLPTQLKSPPLGFDDEEVVLRLHDEGDDGRLFKMKAW